MPDRILLEMKGITKTFPGVKALDNVSFQVKEHHIHALVGENGAGKSTLMNVLSGVYRHGDYIGDIVFDGEVCQFKGIRDSEARGIVIIHQELALVPQLSVAENVFLGNERLAGRGVVDWSRTHFETDKLLKTVGLNIDPEAQVQTLGVGKQQLIEIAKALSKHVKLLILDEPTAALNDEESEKLLQLLLRLRSEGITSIIISHKINEVREVADEITVLRDGATIETLMRGVDDITEERIIRGMVGRDLAHRFPPRVPNIDRSGLFEVRNWTVTDEADPSRAKLKDVNLRVARGEVVGIAGLMGAGRTEFVKSVFGHAYGASVRGEIFLDGKKIRARTPHEAISHGLAYVTEDRKVEGLMLNHSVSMNLTLSNLKRVGSGRTINPKLELSECEKLRDEFRIKAPDLYQAVGNLSGGNQQKVMLGKWVFAEPEVLLLDEPTRGIDVGAKYEVYTIINKLAGRGKRIIVISSEMAELIGLCDRIYIMNEGRIVGEVAGSEATQESIMATIIQSSKE
ncbi:MAG: sugar ABC transporter ATP-binding protein [Clostridiales bacterium]|jgi:putative multiple sugar transport system ATP-binding protein|nr:sugar ABC transporter ATP-binding protein [Clostridiales bacterium]